MERIEKIRRETTLAPVRDGATLDLTAMNDPHSQTGDSKVKIPRPPRKLETSPDATRGH